MSVTVELPSAFLKFTNDEDEVEVSGSSVREALKALCEQYSDLNQQLHDDSGDIRNFINVYVNDDDIRHAKGLDTPVADGDFIQLVPSIAGGRK